MSTKIAPASRISKTTTTRTATACLGCGKLIILEENSPVLRASDGVVLGHIHKPPANVPPRAIHHCTRMAFERAKTAAIIVEGHMFSANNLPQSRSETMSARNYTGPGSAVRFANQQRDVTHHTFHRPTPSHIPH